MDQQQDQQQSRWRSTRRQVLGLLGIVAALAVAVLIGYRYGITLWDWIKLLIVPAVIAGGGLWFNVQQREREQRIASERAQDEALQGYLDGMSQLLSDKERPLHKAQPGDTLSAVARARTLTLLSRLGGGRKKRSVLEFLWEARLIDRERTVRDESNLIERWHNIASLVNADLSGADLSVSAVDPRIWPGADLRQADLSGAKLSGANLSGAILVEAKGWTEEQLLVANSLERTTMPDGQVLRSDVNPKGPTFEDWLKSSSRGEDGENSGPS